MQNYAFNFFRKFSKNQVYHYKLSKRKEDFENKAFARGGGREKKKNRG